MLNMDEMMPSSQPVSSTIEEIQTVRYTLDRQIKKLSMLKTNDQQYVQCVKSINGNLLQLQGLNITVGDLRVTKIGKFMTKLEHSLPPELSAVAVKVNNHWKGILRAYREDFKRTISSKDLDNNVENKAIGETECEQGKSAVSLGFSAVQLLTHYRRSASDNHSFKEQNSTNPINSNCTETLLYGEISTTREKNNVDDIEYNNKGTYHQTPMSLPPLPAHVQQQQQQQQLLQGQQQQQNQQLKTQQQTIRNEQQKSSDSRAFSLKQAMVSSFTQKFRKALDNTTQRVHSVQKECLNILDFMDQMKSDLENFENNVNNQLLYLPNSGMEDTMQSNENTHESLNPSHRQSHLTETSTEEHQVVNTAHVTTVGDHQSSSNPPTLSEHLEHNKTLESAATSGSVNLLNNLDHGQKELSSVVSSVFAEISVGKRRKSSINDSDNDTLVPKKKQQTNGKQLQHSDLSSITPSNLPSIAREVSLTLERNLSPDDLGTNSFSKKIQTPIRPLGHKPQPDLQQQQQQLQQQEKKMQQIDLNSQQVKIKVEPVDSDCSSLPRNNLMKRSSNNWSDVQRFEPYQPKNINKIKKENSEFSKQGQYFVRPEKPSKQQQRREEKNPKQQQPHINGDVQNYRSLQSKHDNLCFISKGVDQKTDISKNNSSKNTRYASQHSTSTNVTSIHKKSAENTPKNITALERNRVDSVEHNSLEDRLPFLQNQRHEQHQLQQQQHVQEQLKEQNAMNSSHNGFTTEISKPILSESLVIAGNSNDEVIVRDNNNLKNVSSSDEEFFTFSQQVYDMESDELDSGERETLLKNSAKFRGNWNVICKKDTGVKYAPLVKSNGRMKAAHQSSVAKQGMSKLLDSCRKNGKLQILLNDTNKKSS